MDINRIRELAGVPATKKIVETKVTEQFGNIKLYDEMKFKNLANSLGAKVSINENTSITVGVVSFEETTIEESKQKMAAFSTAWNDFKAGKTTVTEGKGVTYVLYVGEKGSGKLGQQFSDDSSAACHQEFKDSWGNDHDKDGKKIKYVHKVVAVKDGEKAPTQLDETKMESLLDILDDVKAVSEEHEDEKEANTDKTSKEESEEGSEKNDCDEEEKEEVKESTEEDDVTEGFDSLKSVAAEYKELKAQGNATEAAATYRELVRLAGSEEKAKEILKGKEVVSEDNNFLKRHSEDAPDLSKGVHDADDLNDRMGIKQEREKKIAVPAEIKSSVANRIKELKASIEQYDEKGYNDHSQKGKAIECLEHIMENLALGNVEGLKQAQIFFGTLMSPITDLFPSNLITFLANAQLTWLDKLKK